MIDTNYYVKQIKHFGTEVDDLNHNRKVKELVGYQVEVHREQIIELLATRDLLQKYSPELMDFQKWYDSHFPLYLKPEHRRQVVYFNNDDHDNRMQCISLFQIIDDTMVVYQRSADTIKMLDDLRFFCEIIQRYFFDVQHIKINYGSFHTQINDNE